MALQKQLPGLPKIKPYTPSIMAQKLNTTELTTAAREVRELILRTAARTGVIHIGSSLSPVDLLVALYYEIMNIDPSAPKDPNRDRFILSKGHGGLSQYAVLAMRGIMPMHQLDEYMKDNSLLPVHPVLNSAPGIEATTGSLGHGLGIAVGMALAAKKNKADWRTFTILSDGECDEGSTWEAALLAGHLQLDNLVVMVDYNKIQGFGNTKDILDLEPFADKWRAARFAVQEIDGHNFDEIMPALRNLPLSSGKPTALICHTVKGKGIPYMENTLKWHYSNLKPEDLDTTLDQLS